MWPDLALRRLYFNPKYLENHIIRALEFESCKVCYYNGKKWETVDRKSFAEIALENPLNLLVNNIIDFRLIEKYPVT